MSEGRGGILRGGWARLVLALATAAAVTGALTVLMSDWLGRASDWIAIVAGVVAALVVLQLRRPAADR